MSNYAISADCARLFQDINNYLGALDIDDYITDAHAWVVDTIRPFFTPPSNTPSRLLVLAEANYAVFLILRAAEQEIKAISFQQEAWKLIRHLTSEADTQDTSAGGPASSSSDIEPEFTTGKYDTNGNYIGNKSGIADNNKGSLDDW